VLVLWMISWSVSASKMSPIPIAAWERSTSATSVRVQKGYGQLGVAGSHLRFEPEVTAGVTDHGLGVDDAVEVGG
jgi:hypothetical protein